MKHQVELRLPSIFKRDKKNDNPQVTTKVFIEDEIKEIPLNVIVGTTLIIGLTAGYLVGHMRGVKSSGNTYIFHK